MYNPYLSGEMLYGEDLPPAEIERWFESEREGYSQLTHREGSTYQYSYHALNQRHAFDHLPGDINFSRALGVGSAQGDEFVPIQERVGDITFLEPGNFTKSPQLTQPTVQYAKPGADGVFPFSSTTFDLIVCFSALHHIPKVSQAISEIFRVLRPGGWALLREPIISMGDWRHSRFGLTKNERGIPHVLLRRFVREAGFRIVYERMCCFSLTSRLRVLTRDCAYNSRRVMAVDSVLCSIPFWPTAYHPVNVFHKLRPTAAAFVLKRGL
jgi:SAM-dependent methyltransferase